MKRRTKSGQRVGLSDKSDGVDHQKITVERHVDFLIPSMRAPRLFGGQKRLKTISFRTTEPEHAFGEWLADQSGFKSVSHMMQTFLIISNDMNDQRLKYRPDGTPIIILRMANGYELPLKPLLIPSFGKRDILIATESKLILKDGRRFWKRRTSLGSIVYSPMDEDSSDLARAKPWTA